MLNRRGDRPDFYITYIILVKAAPTSCIITTHYFTQHIINCTQQEFAELEITYKITTILDLQIMRKNVLSCVPVLCENETTASTVCVQGEQFECSRYSCMYRTGTGYGMISFVQ